MTSGDAFVKWVLGITASLVVVILTGIFSSILSLREDMSAIKVELSNVRTEVGEIQQIKEQVDEHEYRIRFIESGAGPGTAYHEGRSTTGRDHTSRYRSDTIISSP